MTLNAIFQPVPEGGYVCWLEEMPGVQSQGETLEEARENLRDAYQLAMEYLRDRSQKSVAEGSVREIIELTA